MEQNKTKNEKQKTLISCIEKARIRASFYSFRDLLDKRLY